MSESIMLSTEEIQTLTGCKRKSDQILWLNQNNLQFFVNKLGRPVVIKTILTGLQSDIKEEQEPNFGALKDGEET